MAPAVTRATNTPPPRRASRDPSSGNRSISRFANSFPARRIDRGPSRPTARSNDLRLVEPKLARLRMCSHGRAAPEDRLDIVAIRVEHERGVVARRITPRGVAKPWGTVIGTTRFQCGLVEGVHRGAALRDERGVLLDAVRVKAVDPEHRVVHTVAHPVGSVARG